MNNGWIKLHRKILDWEWYDDPNTFRLFLHLLLIANHEDKKYRGVLVKRGSVVTGRIKLAEELGLTEQQVRTALSKLKSTSEITSQSTNQFTVVTVVNYDKYQQDNQPITERITNEQPTDNHKQELKNVKNTTPPTPSSLSSHSSMNYLLAIPSEELEQISKDLGIEKRTIILKGKSLYDWLVANGRTKKNYRAFLTGCLRRDFAEAKATRVSSLATYETIKPRL